MLPIIQSLIGLGLPMLGKALAAKGKDFIEEKLNVDLGSMLGSEEGRIKLAQLEMEHEQFLQGIILEREEQRLKESRMLIDDTDSARKMQTAALSQEDLFSKRFIYYFAWFWSFASVGYIGFITFGTIPEANVRFADTILGFLLGTTIAMILQYFFGSSNQSKVKDNALAEAIKGVTQK